MRWCCAQGQATRDFVLTGKPDETLHIALKEFTDLTGRIHYVIARTNGEVPWVSGDLVWKGPGTTGYELFTTAGSTPRRVGTQVNLNLRPGAGKLLAFLEAPVAGIRVQAPAALVAGGALHLTVAIVDAQGKGIPGAFPCTLRVTTPAGEILGLQRSVSLQSGEAYLVNTALSDPAGTWTITVTDGISGTVGTATVKVTAPAVRGPRYAGWNLRSEVEEPLVMGPDEFLTRLHTLADLYRTPQDGTKWMAKQNLGYFYDYFPGTRHTLLRPLNDVDWPAFATALRADVTNGAHLILTGEDVGIDPGTGLGTWPHHDGAQLAALQTALVGATWTRATADGNTLRAVLGKGEIMLCRESIDAAGNTNPEAARWQARWLEEVAKGAGTPVSAVNLTTWWTTGSAPWKAPCVVTWFADNQREETLTVDPANRLTSVVILVLPGANVTGFTWTLKADAPVRLDVGCDGSLDTGTDLAGAVMNYLAHAVVNNALYHDGNGSILVPIRLAADKKTTVTLSGVRVECAP